MPNRRIAALAGLALLGGCGRTPLPQAAAPLAGVCRVGPDGGPDRGWIADKGIGGTGAPALADRGIGGTGIVAVISGFASLCLAGQEVALPAETPIVLGSDPSSTSQLRAGQVAVVEARDTGGGLSAVRVMIRFEVSGPVEAVTDGQLVVAGQRVAVSTQTLGIRPLLGDWIAVSGIRRGDGVIEATRLEQRSPEPLVVHGVLRLEEGAFKIGSLVLARTPGMDALIGQNVTAAGPLLIGRLATETIMPDLLASDPGTFFGPAVGVVLIEGFAAPIAGPLAGPLAGPIAGPIAGLGRTAPQRGIYRFERGTAGLRAVDGGPETNRRAAFGPAASPGGQTEGFTPAPVPDRAQSSGDGAFRRSSSGVGGPGSPIRNPIDAPAPGRGGPGRGAPERGGKN